MMSVPTARISFANFMAASWLSFLCLKGVEVLGFRVGVSKKSRRPFGGVNTFDGDYHEFGGR